MAGYHSEVSVDGCENEALPSAIAPGEIVLGTLVGINGEGKPQVDYVGNPADSPTVAITTVDITGQHINRQVAILFADGDYGKPVVIGLIHSPLHALLENLQPPAGDDQSAELGRESEDSEANIAHVDGESVVIEGKKEIVLKCGEASITLTRAGKILIRGKYLLNRSSGVNRILGGSVQVN